MNFSLSKAESKLSIMSMTLASERGADCLAHADCRSLSWPSLCLKSSKPLLSVAISASYALMCAPFKVYL